MVFDCWTKIWWRDQWRSAYLLDDLAVHVIGGLVVVHVGLDVGIVGFLFGWGDDEG